MFKFLFHILRHLCHSWQYVGNFFIWLEPSNLKPNVCVQSFKARPSLILSSSKNLSMRRNAPFVKMLPQLLKFYFLSSIQKIKPICWGANLSMSRRFRDIFVASKDFLLKLLIHKNHGFWEFSAVRNWIMAQKFNRRRLAADGGYLKWKKFVKQLSSPSIKLLV